MQISINQDTRKRRAINLTIREDILEEVKSLKLNASKAAEAGLLEAVKQAKAQSWLRANKKALEAHNKRISKDGVLLPPEWDY